MGFLKRAIRRGVSEAVGNAIGKAVQQAIEPKATELVNKAAGAIDQAAQQQEAQRRQEAAQRESALEGALGNWQRATENYATQAAQNLKLCPGCGQSCSAEKKFCPNCGAKLPENTVAQGAVCSACGKQNTVGTKFCSECGTKLPAAIEEEQRQAKGDEETLVRWARELPFLPVWNCGGAFYELEEDPSYGWRFSASFEGNAAAARQAVAQYRNLAMQYGFHPAGEYPSQENLYNRVDGMVWDIDTEHCFDGDPDCPSIYFIRQEPAGGYDYVKPEPRKPASLRDLFKL